MYNTPQISNRSCGKTKWTFISKFQDFHISSIATSTPKKKKKKKKNPRRAAVQIPGVDMEWLSCEIGYRIPYICVGFSLLPEADSKIV